MLSDVYCTEETVVKCCHCGHISRVGNLNFVPSYALPEPGGKNSPTGHWHCVCGKYLAYQQAENRTVLSDPEYAKLV